MTSNDYRATLDARSERLRKEVEEMKARTVMPTTVRRLPPKNRSRSGRRRIIR